MKSIIITEKKRKPTFLALPLGLAAGFLNGLLGAGGGIVLIFVYKALGKGGKDDAKDAFAMTAATIIPISLFSLFGYLFKGETDISPSLIYLLPGVIGGILGALITDKIKTDHLKLIFGVLTIIAGFNMILR